MSLSPLRPAFFGLLALGALTACSDDDPADNGSTAGDPAVGDPSTEIPRDDDIANAECSVVAQNTWVYDSLQDYYLFYDEVPALEPERFDSPQAVLEAGRFLERDPFSFLTETGGNSLAFDQGRSFGLGLETRFDEQRRVLVSLVEPASPIGQAGVERGDRIVSIDARDPVEVFGDRAYVRETLVGTPERPGRSTWVIEPRGGSTARTIELEAREFGLRTVPFTSTITHPTIDGTIGYLVFTSFLNTSDQELDDAFAFFAEQGVTELVLDLRYNRGGFVRVAASLATRIAGNTLAGSRLYDYRHNDKYRQKDYTLVFEPVADSLELSRVAVLTTADTASSSEIVISGLSPYIEVVTVGSRTGGKPYIQSANDRCGARLFAVEAEGINAERASVFGGIEPNCLADDDLSADFGLNPTGDAVRPEGMLRVALDRLVFGVCPSSSKVAAGLEGRSGKAADLSTLLYADDRNAYAIPD